jgi:hypothetical protein
MERAAGQVRPQRLIRKHRLALFLSLVVAPAGLHARGGGEFLLIQHPERLVVYNRYQQQATEAERDALKPFVPIRIVKAQALLPDGYTRCMEVEIDGAAYFVLMDKKGRLSGSGPLGSEKRFHNTALLSDTVEILREQTVEFLPIDAPSGLLQKGEKVVRIFRDQDRVYCRRTGGEPVYGWTSLAGKGGGRNWKVLTTSASQLTSIPPAIVEKVESRIDQTNRLLAKLFEHFNNETHQQKEIPHWEVESSRTAISCTLESIPGGESFERSTPYLVKDIENIVLGSNLAVSHSPGRIEIRLQ